MMDEYWKIELVDPDSNEILLEGIFRSCAACFLWLHLFEMSEGTKFDYFLNKVKLRFDV